MPHTFTVEKFVVGDDGVTNTHIPSDAKPFYTHSNISEFTLLQLLLAHVDIDWTPDATSDEKMFNVVGLMTIAVDNDEFTIYSKVNNTHARWNLRITRHVDKDVKDDEHIDVDDIAENYFDDEDDTQAVKH
jgi:hypothetical protein